MYRPRHQKSYPRGPIDFHRIPHQYQLNIIHRQPAITVVRLASTSNHALQTAELVLSRIPDLMLIWKIIQFFQETYPDYDKAKQVLRICTYDRWHRHHSHTFQYLSTYTIYNYKLYWSEIIPPLNEELRIEVEERHAFLQTLETSRTIEDEWSRLNLRGPGKINLADVPGEMRWTIISKCSFAVVTRLWRTCNQMRNTVACYTNFTPKICWFFMIPGVQILPKDDELSTLELHRQILWDTPLLWATIECLRRSDILDSPRNIRAAVNVEYMIVTMKYSLREKKPTITEFLNWGYCPIQSVFRLRYLHPRQRLFLKPVVSAEDQ